MIARRTRWYLPALIGVAGLLTLAACSTNEPYGARFDENGYSYTHRQHGLYNDAQYRSQRSRYDYDDGYRYGYAPPVQYNYYYYHDGGYRPYGYRQPGYRYYYDDDDREAVYDEGGYLIYYRNRHRD
jgi:hypothetical protein